MRKAIPVIIYFAGTLLFGFTAKDRTNTKNDAPITQTGCGSQVLFKQGTTITAATYDGQNKLVNTSVSKVSRVFSEGGATVAEMAVTSKDSKGKSTTNTAKYKCDGSKIIMDFSQLLQQNQGGQGGNVTVTSSGFDFPHKPAVGGKLPDVVYHVSTSQGGRKMDLKSTMKDRKVEKKERVTTTAGTFDCFKVSAIVDVDMNIPGMDANTQKMMEQMKSQMPKSTVVMWYDPANTVIKMEFKMGEKMISRTEVTQITK